MKPHSYTKSKSHRIPLKLKTGPSFPVASDGDTALRVDEPREVLSGVFGEVTSSMAEATPCTEEARHETATLLRRAGFLAPSAYVDFAAVRYASTIGAILLLGVTVLLAPPALEPLALAGLVAFPAAMWVGTRSVAERLARRRTERIARAIPDLMSLVSFCVRQGLSVPAAFIRAGRDLAQSCPELAREIELVGVQTDLGTFAHALRVFRARLEIPEVDTLTSVLIQSSELGSGVCESLSKCSTNIRQQHREQQSLFARLTPQRVLIPTVLFLIPAALLVFAAPTLVEMLGSVEAAVIK